MVDKNELYAAADEIRSEGVLVAQSSVMARLESNIGRAGSPRDVGPYLLEWKADRNYAPVLERGGVPKTVSTRLEKAAGDLWSAAQAEADLAFQADRERFEVTLSDERALRAETLAMADGLLREAAVLTATAKDLRTQITELKAELTATRQHLQAVRADQFWDRVVHDIHAILPTDGSMSAS